MSNPNTDRKRVRKAIRMANRILFSYMLLVAGRKIFGVRFYEKRIHKAHQKNAKRVKKAVSELQGLFTKVGQLMSMMSNILPNAYAEVLESLQDHAPPSPIEDSKKIIEEDLNEKFENVFEDFNQEPIASASIGQVYKAKLSTGELVAVKVQHKNITQLAYADLEIIRKLVKRVNFFVKVNGIEFVYEQVRKMVLDELDFKKEQVSMVTIGENLKNVKGVSVPQVFTEYSSSRIITTSFQDAVKITNKEKIKEWGLSGDKLSETLILAYCKMILEDGFYHADPHPGNVFLRKDGEIILLDFGAVAVLNEPMRKEIPVLIQAAIRKDYGQVVHSLQKMGFVGEDGGSRKVAQKIVETVSQFLSSEVEIKNLNIKDISIDDVKGSSLDRLRKELSIKELSKTVRVPKDWVLLDRTLILVSGISSTIAPDLDPVSVIKPYMKKQMLLKGGIKDMIMDGIKQQFTAIFNLPVQLDTFLKKANNGELELEVKSETNDIYTVGRQFVLSVLLIASVFFYYLSKQQFWLYITAFFALWIMRSFWKNRMKS